MTTLNGFLAATAALCSVSVALVLSPWNTASLETTEDINATASVVREKLTTSSLHPCSASTSPSKKQWTNKFSANIRVDLINPKPTSTPTTQIHDARTLCKNDTIQITNFFGTGRTTVQENSARSFALKGTGLGTTAAHSWDFVPMSREGGVVATRLVHRETWTGGLSFLFMRFGPVRGLLEEMFRVFNKEVRESAEGA
ncbi:hypothetical protein Q7P37_011614 [Cladosporium fusiforme]